MFFSLWNLQWQSLTDVTVFNAQRNPKTTVKENLNKCENGAMEKRMENLHDVSRTYASMICRGDFVVVFSMVFSVFSVSSPWRSLPSSAVCRVRSFL